MSNEPEDTSKDRSLLVPLVDGPVFLLALLTFTSFLGRQWWVFELTTHFRLQYAIGLAVAGLVYVLLSEIPRALVAILLILPHAYLIAPYYAPAGSLSETKLAEGERLSCMSINVSLNNSRRGRVVNLVRSEQPDLLLLMEVELEWVRNRTGLNELYEHRKIVSRSDQFGMALFSSHALSDTRVLRPAHTAVSVLYTTIKVGDRNLHVTGVHTPSPIASHLARSRNRVLSGVAERVAAQSDPRIVMGDLNTTSWSPYFQDFMDRTGLRDSRMGRGLNPSWPASTRIWPLQICIDHILHSDDITVLNRRVGPDVGSDHLPIMARFYVPDPH
jgi:endonuclease/exonuclease/phosphatase (EEP) superfamily protein YafD